MRAVTVSAFVAILSIAGASQAFAQDAASAAAGEKLYTAQRCSMCHSVAGKGNAKGALDDVGSRLTDEDIRQWLINPKVMIEKTKATRKPAMPAYAKLTKEELESLVAYLKTLKQK